jgi:hypothetical protein
MRKKYNRNRQSHYKKLFEKVDAEMNLKNSERRNRYDILLKTYVDFKNLSEKIHDNLREEWMKNDCDSHFGFDESKKNNLDYIIRKVKIEPSFIWDASIRLQNDKEVNLYAVKKDSNFYHYIINNNLKQDIDIIIQVITDTEFRLYFDHDEREYKDHGYDSNLVEYLPFNMHQFQLLKLEMKNVEFEDIIKFIILKHIILNKYFSIN